MVVIRLTRGGSKKRPFYHIVAADKRKARDGRNIERLGYFNPVASGNEIRLHIDMDRLASWIEKGAQPSERVQTLIKDAKKGPEAVAAERAKKAEKQAQKKATVKAKAEAEAKASEAEAAPEAAEAAPEAAEAAPEAAEAAPEAAEAAPEAAAEEAKAEETKSEE